MASINGVGAGLLAILVYVFQDEPVSSEGDEYAAIITQVQKIGKQLSTLSAFLERERKRIADTASTLSRLQDEKTKLEPVVASQRETVEAILAAYSSRLVSKAWKERIIGFSLGILASLVAGFLYDVFKR